jgi:nitrile hydratase beta subunit
MNGVHDMGGMHGLGPVERQEHEPVFHHSWEGRVYALRQACGALGKWNIDMARHANERMPATEYLAATYYERWLWGLETLLAENGVLTSRELAEGRAQGPAPDELRQRVLKPEAVERRVRTGGCYRADVDIAPRFGAGDAVRARNIHPSGHTRLPRYAREHRGVVEGGRGVFIFPDANAAGLGHQPQHLYTVRFEGRELWGPNAEPNTAVYLDLWDAHLEAA